ncbi:YbaB/EbfC family nucleoid-associated protein [Nocardia mangyaensis]|nr:YbaB/EbfC family nucleoid-associated protein [Nocardia mangyaensis]
MSASNDFPIPDLAAVMDDYRAQMSQLNEVQQQRDQLTAKVTVRKCVTVTVNADGQVIETAFASRVEDLSYSEIAKAVTEAAQQAAAEVMRKSMELLAPLYENNAQLPKLSDFLPEIDEAGMAPGSASWGTALNGDVVDGSDAGTRPGRSGGVTDSSW